MEDKVQHGGYLDTAKGQCRAMSLGTFAAVVCLIAALHLAFWPANDPRTNAPSVEGKLPSVSYNRFADPSEGASVSQARICADLAAIAAQARAVRTYSSTQGLEQVPEIAAELGLTVTLGIWIDKDNARNEREISTALELAHRYPNVTRLVVGNETIFRHEQTAASLAKIINRVKQNSPVPVATADHWKFFINNPELVGAVDQVFAHILPYWGGVPKSAVDGSIEIYDRLLKAYPARSLLANSAGQARDIASSRRLPIRSARQSSCGTSSCALVRWISTTTLSRRSTNPKNSSKAMSVLLGHIRRIVAAKICVDWADCRRQLLEEGSRGCRDRPAALAHDTGADPRYG
jgi:hypothetical protein